MAKAGARPVVDIYSTFLQRSFDQIFQEVALQNLPVVFSLDRAGLVGADGPTHHGSYDLAYMRVFPNMVVMAPGDEQDVAPMLDFALAHDVAGRRSATPRRTSRRSTASSSRSSWARPRSSSGRPTACSSPAARWSATCLRAAERLRERVRPAGRRGQRPVRQAARPDDDAARRSRSAAFVLTVEEGCLMGGFGSAVLEAANDAGLATAHVRRLGLPDRFVLHAERDEQLAEVGLDVDGIARSALELARAVGLPVPQDGAECAVRSARCEV